MKPEPYGFPKLGRGLVAVGIGLIGGAALVSGLEYAGVGREGALRDAVRECNRAYPNSTNKVGGLYSPFLSGAVYNSLKDFKDYTDYK